MGSGRHPGDAVEPEGDMAVGWMPSQHQNQLEGRIGITGIDLQKT